MRSILSGQHLHSVFCDGELYITSDKGLPPLRILLVEDEALISLLIESMLSDLGHVTVDCAHSVQHALSLLDPVTKPFDAAMLDINLGGTLVFPVAEALAARDIPFAFLTGYGANGVPKRFADAAVIQKPFTEKDLAYAMDTLQRQHAEKTASA
jgi:CheY-like chemotaxis protein